MAKMVARMTKSDEIDLRHKFEAECRGSGFDLAMNSLGHYKNPQVQGMWVEVKLRGEA